MKKTKAVAQEWFSRREIPDPHIRDTASQFENARVLLAAQPPGSGVLLPSLNVAAMSVELHLKSLSAESIHTPDPEEPEFSIVTAQSRHGHSARDLFAAVPPAISAQLSLAVNEIPRFRGRALPGLLDNMEGLFAASRYAYESDSDISRYNYEDIMTLSEAIARFVVGLESRFTIAWRPSDDPRISKPST